MNFNMEGQISLGGQIAHGLVTGKVTGVLIELTVSCGKKRSSKEFQFTLREHDNDQAVGILDIGNGQLMDMVITPIGGPDLIKCFCKYKITERSNKGADESGKDW